MSKIEELEMQIKKWRAVLLQAFIVGEDGSYRSAEQEMEKLELKIMKLKVRDEK